MIPKIYPVACHTKNIGPGSTFVAIPGQHQDGVIFISSAIEKGANRIVIKRGACVPDDAVRIIKQKNIDVLEVDHPRKALAELSAQAAGFPAQQLKIIGITGTKGKTTTSFLLHHMLQTAGFKTALLSTVHNKIGQSALRSELTTAQPDFLHQFFAHCVQQGITHVVMEVAAQAFSLFRVHGIAFSGGIFTNFSHEHLEFYKDLNEYFQAKCELFFQCKPDAPILINADDAKIISAAPVHAHTFGCAQHADLKIAVTKSDVHGIAISCNGALNVDLKCPTLFGTYNAYNIAAAAFMARQLGASQESIHNACSNFPAVPGRLETYTMPNGSLFVIDYAHTPDSYRVLFETLRTQTDHLIVIFGAGGGRDPYKRPMMGAIAAQFAQLIILTNDNPRNEDPLTIIQDIRQGIPDGSSVHVEMDRKKAMEYAYANSRNGSIIAVLGKGPDAYQMIGNEKIPFSEKDIVCSFVNS